MDCCRHSSAGDALSCKFERLHHGGWDCRRLCDGGAGFGQGLVGDLAHGRNSLNAQVDEEGLLMLKSCASSLLLRKLEIEPQA